MVQNPPAADHHDAAGTGGGGSSSTGPTSWMGHKQRGRECYEGGDYSQALASYRAALHPEYRCPDQERQILLSNVVACRLKLGGPAQAEAAVSDAKRCVRIDPNWAKGHVRLASAYVATDNPANSNDACNALQTALRLDPGNTLARQMLVRELRRDHRPASSQTSSRDEPPRPPAQNPNYVPPSSSSSFPARAASRSRTGGAGAGSSSASTSSSSWSTTAGPQPYEATAPPLATAPQHEDHQPQQQQQQPDPPDIDDQLSWLDRVRFYTSRVNVWYGNLSADTRTAIVVAAVVLILYASFAMDASNSSGYYSSRSSGGSGGNSGNQRRREGNYGAGNAYDQYRHRRDGGGSSSSYYRGYYGENYRENHNNYGWSLSHVFDGGSGLQVMLLVLAVGYGCHLMGINPLHALLLLRIVGGGGRRRGGVFYGGGYGGRGAFYNVGVLRQRHHHHPARPRGWW